MYTEPEIRFLMQSHSVEHAAGVRELKPVRDLRQLGCPAPLFFRILEDRRLKLGKRFTDFQNANQPQPNGEVVALEVEVENAKLF